MLKKEAVLLISCSADRTGQKRVAKGSSLPTFFALCSLLFAFLTGYAVASEDTSIDAQSVEYIQETSTYVAKGAVKIKKADMLMEADEITYNKESSEATASGNVKFNNADLSFTASRAELNLDEKTGLLHDAEVFLKKDNYHIYGKLIEKKGENAYVIPDALFTTCDAPVPAWCFRGKNVDALVGDRLEADNVTFRVKNVPVFYTPYLWAPIQADRTTGFLLPFIGSSNTKGVYMNIPFFWAISENRDATLSLDIYTKRGVGEGLEYRYLYPGDVKGKWWIYHLYDTELSKNFFEVKGLHDQRSSDGVGGFLNLNIINEEDFYREFETRLEARTNRFLESTGEISAPFVSSRAYLLSQYWIDLKEGAESPAQKLPEIGYVLNPVKTGPFWISTTAAFSNFWRQENTDGRRLDLYPKVSYKTGDDVTLLQTLGLRETAYFLDRDEEESTHRESLGYTAGLSTRFLKKYGSFTHIVEPSLSYSLITNAGKNPIIFDSEDIFEKTSLFELSLMNRFIDNKGEFMAMRIAQGFDTHGGDRPFQPLHLEVGIKRPFSIRLDTRYDVNTGKIENVNSDISMAFSFATISAGERYNRLNEITYYTAGLDLNFLKPLYLGSRIWYDAELNETREVSLNLKYISQCWGMNIGFTNRPGEFTMTVLFELTGLTKGLKLNQ